MTTDVSSRWRLLAAGITITVVSVGWALALCYLARGGIQ